MERRYPELLHPHRVWTRAEVLGTNSPVPRAPGVYAWYFQEIPPGVPTDGCITHDGLTLLDIGIAPKEVPANGAKPSGQTLWHRVRYHLRGNAFGSTLRRSLGCLMSEELGIELRRVRSKRSTKGEDEPYRNTFTKPGEAILSEWFATNAFVTWREDEEPWKAEEDLIHSVSLPLNLDQNTHHGFHAILAGIRKAERVRADQLPVVRE